MRLPWDPEAQREQRHAEPGARPRGPPRLRTGAGECRGSGARPDLQRTIPAPRPRGPAAGAPNRYDATTAGVQEPITRGLRRRGKPEGGQAQAQLHRVPGL